MRFRQPAQNVRMVPKAMDSLDLVEAVMLIEEVFGPLRMSVGSGFSLPVAFL
jgi:hypothetical protein